MDSIENGFRLADRLVPWGTLINTLADLSGERGYTTVELPCAAAYDFPTVHVELTAPRPDRPVMSVAYELDAAALQPKEIFAQLVIRLGAPDAIDRSEVPSHASPSDSVVLHASWQRSNRSISVALYGAPRPSDFGPGAGKLYLSWGDMDAAAAPFLKSWLAANAELARLAQSAANVQTFGVAEDIHPIQGPFEADDAGRTRRAARLCFHSPEILETPAPIADRLRPPVFALWSNAAGARWHLSSLYDTVTLGRPDSSSVQFLDIEPARGGGFSSIEVGSWIARSHWRSGTITDAVRALERQAGVTVEHHTGHDA